MGCLHKVYLGNPKHTLWNEDVVCGVAGLDESEMGHFTTTGTCNAAHLRVTTSPSVEPITLLAARPAGFPTGHAPRH